MAVAYCLLQDPKHRYETIESDCFEDAVRKAVSIGWDSDTLACITGGIAEAFYTSIPQEMIDRTVKAFPKIFNKILEEYKTLTLYGGKYPTMNCIIK